VVDVDPSEPTRAGRIKRRPLCAAEGPAARGTRQHSRGSRRPLDPDEHGGRVHAPSTTTDKGSKESVAERAASDLASTLASPDTHSFSHRTKHLRSTVRMCYRIGMTRRSPQHQPENALGTYLRAVRSLKQISLRQMARDLEMNHSVLGPIECGLTLQPSIETLERISDGYGIPLLSLLERANYPLAPSEHALLADERRLRPVMIRMNTEERDHVEYLLARLRNTRTR